MRRITSTIGLIAWWLASEALVAQPCRIDVVERGSDWPVPMVELRTTHHAVFVTDNAGRIAFDLPELMGRETWFEVRGHGYEVAKDGFGQRGVRLKPVAGGQLRVEVKRTSIARRIGRLTGADTGPWTRELCDDVDPMPDYENVLTD